MSNKKTPDLKPVEICHIYEKKGDYIIEANSEDEKGLASGKSTFEVTIPRFRAEYHKFLFRWFEHFLNAFPLLRLLLGLY